MNSQVAAGRWWIAGFLLLLAVLPTVEACTRDRPVTPIYGVAEIQARLFYSNSGRLSGNIVDNPGFSLWNVIIGEGSAEGPSDQMLVQVRVVGPPRAVAEEITLRVIARTAKRTLLNKRVQVGQINSAGRYYAGFWLDGIGCEPVAISAELAGKGAGPGLERTIPFSCGE
jgi:hypothetical protein